MATTAILAALLAENTEKCAPPLSDAEVRKIAESVGRYEPGVTTEDALPRTEAPRHKFETLGEGRYKLSLDEYAAEIEVDRLRRSSSGELIGELFVRCALPGVQSFDGTMSAADFNLSSARARAERGRLLEKKSENLSIIWESHLEELCQRVIFAERKGKPAVDLRTLPRPAPDDSIKIEGLVFPRRHPSIIFGDGGTAKSYLALFIIGTLAQQGMRVGLFDWELDEDDHRDRLERLFGEDMPEIYYARCGKPLMYETDRLARIVADERLEFVGYDSIAFACAGPPESAESAGQYFRAVRQIGIGGLHIAHITKSDGGDQKPFGSVFWHNGARATYFVQLSNESPDGRTISIGLFNRKANLGKLQQPTGFDIEFAPEGTYFTRSNPADNPDLAETMSLSHRMRHLLRSGSLPFDEIAETLGAKPETIKRTVRRGKKMFTVIEGGKVGLLNTLR